MACVMVPDDGQELDNRIVALYASRTNVEIAQELGISLYRVKNRVRTLFKYGFLSERKPHHGKKVRQ